MTDTLERAKKKKPSRLQQEKDKSAILLKRVSDLEREVSRQEGRYQGLRDAYDQSMARMQGAVNDAHRIAKRGY